MSQKVRQIIRSQWSRRNSTSPQVRGEARSLIRVHVQLLRCGKQDGDCFPRQNGAGTA